MSFLFRMKRSFSSIVLKKLNVKVCVENKRPYSSSCPGHVWLFHFQCLTLKFGKSDNERHIRESDSVHTTNFTSTLDHVDDRNNPLVLQKLRRTLWNYNDHLPSCSVKIGSATQDSIPFQMRRSSRWWCRNFIFDWYLFKKILWVEYWQCIMFLLVLLSSQSGRLIWLLQTLSVCLSRFYV